MRTSTNASRRVLVAGVAFGLVLAACGGGTAETTTSAAGTAAPTTDPGSVTTVGPTTTAPATTTAAPTTTMPAATTTTVATTTLPGTPIDFGPAAGDTLAVVGVASDDVLNVRAAPGTDQPIVTTLGPLEDDVTALGNTRQLPNSFWFEVEFGGVTGWASAAFLAYLGDTTDQTALLIATLGETPEAETMLGLGLIVAEAFASDEPASRIVVSVAPTVGDLGEVVYDVIGLGDDSVFGLRLHIFGTPTEGGDGFSLKSVEQTTLCGRGVSDGLCV